MIPSIKLGIGRNELTTSFYGGKFAIKYWSGSHEYGAIPTREHHGVPGYLDFLSSLPDGERYREFVLNPEPQSVTGVIATYRPFNVKNISIESTGVVTVVDRAMTYIALGGTCISAKSWAELQTQANSPEALLDIINAEKWFALQGILKGSD